MSERHSAVLPAALCIGIAVFALLVGAYLVSRTPSDVLDGELVTPATPLPGEPELIDYTVPEGASAADVGSELEELGVIRSARQFQLLLRLMGIQDQLSAGDFELSRGSAALVVIDELIVRESGPVIRVTFPEGIRVEEMAERAQEAGFGTAQEFMEAVAAALPQLPPDIVGVLPPDELVAGPRLQGYLFPDTYILPRGATAGDLVALMLQTFQARVTPEIREAALLKGLDLHRLITLASIVEREAVVDSEREMIAGVFLNRMAAGDRLGADPTTQFAVAIDQASVAEFGWWKQELTALDLENPSPYNTRLNPGLPPGPITNPGLASIEAVAFAPPTELYYFVADAVAGDGSHRFAVTFAEHERNIVVYGSAP